MLTFFQLVFVVLFSELALLTVGALNLSNDDFQPELVLSLYCVERGSYILDNTFIVIELSNLAWTPIMIGDKDNARLKAYNRIEEGA